ncbi:MAG TPA: fumarylacetoacetase [Xanthobacteraceae bacterium]|nr:fumarylacetoacetase [Xanthobacteraceae bacterium]
MAIMLNETHDPARRSFVESANLPGSDFPIQNLPFGVFRLGPVAQPRVGVPIGDQIVDVSAAASLFEGPAAMAAQTCGAPFLNPLMSMGPPAWSALRLALSRELAAEAGSSAPLRPYLTPMAHAEMRMPVLFRNFTDFFASIFHATNAGRLFRPDNPLAPNYKYLPVAYHSRASSVRISDLAVRRPNGQRKGTDGTPSFGPSQRLDFELELGAFVGTASDLGRSVPIGEAANYVFGYCLLNDWSARDIQAWESQPLGPFLGKSFATTISPWVVTAEALAPFHTAAFARPEGDPAPLPHLDDSQDRTQGGLDITLEAYLATEAMRRDGMPPHRLTQTSAASLYWTVAQMIAHHTSNGCNLEIGDLLGSGTVSGPEPSSWGSLLELTTGGSKPLVLPSGEKRTFIEDGDEISFRGFCAKPDQARIGFGECRAVVLPANQAAQ